MFNYRIISTLFILLFVFFSTNETLAQCDPNTPTFTVDLTGTPDGSWISPPVKRKDDCCIGGSGYSNCVLFIVTLDPGAEGITLDLYSGANGNSFQYSVNCGITADAGDPICLSGAGPHTVTLCKNGGDESQYIIQSIAIPEVSTSSFVNNGCSSDINTFNYIESSIQWTSIAPDNIGDWNYYLNCTTGCDTVTVTPSDTLFPSFIDYQVCGNPIGGCATITICDTVRIFFNPTLNASISPNPAVMCPDDTSITLTINTIGGSPPFNFQWNTLETTSSINATGPGTYTVIIDDVSDCPPKALSQIVTQIPGSIYTNAGVDQFVCTTETSVQLNGIFEGGTGIEWSGGSNVFSPNNNNLNPLYFPTPAEIASGSVSLYLTNTGTGNCQAYTDTIVLNFVDFQGINTIDITNASCFGVATGSATISTNGSLIPYSYSWNTTPIQTGTTATNIPEGDYTVDVTDNNGCMIQENFSIIQPSPLTATYSSTDVSCFFGSDGTAYVTPFGGTGPYSYSWAPSGGTDSIATGLSTGNYSVTITDFNSCDTTIVITIDQPNVLTTSITDVTNVSCFSGSDGTATVTVNGGSPGYTFNWSPSGGNSLTGIGLSAGNYNVTVVDSNGCTGIANVIIDQPDAPLSATTSQTNVLCSGNNTGIASVSASGGTPGYSYNWTPSGNTTSSNDNILAGTHSVLITDTNNCSITKTFDILEPSELIISPTFTNSTCGLSNGTINSNVSGGVPPYSYSWSTGDTTSNILDVIAGTYTLTVTDNNNCTDTSTIIVPNETPPLVASVTNFTNVSCLDGNDGSATVEISGGTPGFTYSWSPLGGNQSTGTNLIAGNYTVTVIDTNGCTDTSTVIILEPSSAVSISLTQTNVSCNGGNDGQAFVN
ncbi:hypothetical protein FRY74_06440, partial [Vicingus serpentipes]